MHILEGYTRSPTPSVLFAKKQGRDSHRGNALHKQPCTKSFKTMSSEQSFPPKLSSQDFACGNNKTTNTFCTFIMEEAGEVLIHESNRRGLWSSCLSVTWRDMWGGDHDFHEPQRTMAKEMRIVIQNYWHLNGSVVNFLERRNKLFPRNPNISCPPSLLCDWGCRWMGVCWQN